MAPEMVDSFSCSCEGCGHPVLPTSVTNDVNRWMSLAVSISVLGDPNNVTVVEGRYDGAGRLFDEAGEFHGIACVGFGSGASVWHKACWLVAGSPAYFRGESPPHVFIPGDDGGYGEYDDLPEPPLPDSEPRLRLVR